MWFLLNFGIGIVLCSYGKTIIIVEDAKGLSFLDFILFCFLGGGLSVIENNGRRYFTIVS